MGNLTEMRCEACRPGAPRVTSAEAESFLKEIPEWSVVTFEGIEELRRVFIFENFLKALDFTNRVGALAEEHGHHPALLTEWGRVTVRWWTHAIGGLHVNDFVMAAKTDQLYGRSAASC